MPVNTKEIPNRYGDEKYKVNGVAACCHGIELSGWRGCPHCARLLGERKDRPTLFGTGPVVDLSDFGAEEV